MATHALERHVALIGFMGAGKTTLGVQLAERLGRRFFDLDEEIERESGRTIPELFAERGEAGFRVLEAERTLEVFTTESPAVLVSVESMKALRVAYPNFYIDTDAFLREVDRAIGAKRDETRS